jgi:putative phage-type endonuclease
VSAVLLPKHEYHSPEWHEARRRSIGGSEIAAVLGIHPWTSPFTLWHVKAGLLEPFAGNKSTEWGQRLEPVISAKFYENHFAELIEATEQDRAFAHPSRPWQTASPDVLFGGNGRWQTFCEVKTAARSDAWWDGPPVYYRAQVLWTMDVLGVDHAWLAVLIGGSDYREYTFELDDDAEADLAVMREAGQKFMDSLAANQPPDIDDSYSTYETVRRLSPDIDLDSEHEVSRELAEAFCSTKADFDAAERAYRKARTDIARDMGRANFAVCEGVRVARRQPARGGGPAVLVSTRRKLLPPLEETTAA